MVTPDPSRSPVRPFSITTSPMLSSFIRSRIEGDRSVDYNHKSALPISEDYGGVICTFEGASALGNPPCQRYQRGAYSLERMPVAGTPYFTGTVRGWSFSPITHASNLSGAVVLAFLMLCTSLGCS